MLALVLALMLASLVKTRLEGLEVDKINAYNKAKSKWLDEQDD